MKEFKFHIPVDGLLSISICAEDVKEALEILIEKKRNVWKTSAWKLKFKIWRCLSSWG